MKKFASIFAVLVSVFFFATMASAQSASIEVVGDDLVISVAKAEVPSGVGPQLRGAMTGWNNQPMVDAGNVWTYTKKGGKVYAAGAEFCVDLGGDDYLPEKASDFDPLFTAGLVIYKPDTGGHNYKLVLK